MGDNDENLIHALVEYLEDSLSREVVLRDLLAKAGYNDPDQSVEECLTLLVMDHLRMKVPC